MLQPGQATEEIYGSKLLVAPGVGTIFPCYGIVVDGKSKYCPSRWRAFQVLVGE